MSSKNYSTPISQWDSLNFKEGGTIIGGLGDVYHAMCFLKLLGPAPLLVRYSSPFPWYISGARELLTMMPNVTFEVTGIDEEINPATPRVRNPVKLVAHTGFPPGRIVHGEPGFPQWNITLKPELELPKSYSVLAPQAGGSRENNKPKWRRTILPAEIQRALVELEHPVVLLGDEHCPPVDGTIDLRGKTSLPEAIGIISGAKRFTGLHGVLAYASLSQKVPSCVYIGSNRNYVAMQGRLMKGWVQYCTSVRNREGE